jgi:hypothetical protein
MMQKLAALLMAITGVSVSVLGILLFWVLRRSGVGVTGTVARCG